MLQWLTIAGLLAAMLSGSSRTSAGKTPSFRQATGEVKDILSPDVRNSTVKRYLDQLVFLERAKGMAGSRANIRSCHGCGGSAPLEIAAEMGAINLGQNDLGAEGIITAVIRKDDWLPFSIQEDLKLRWRADQAFLWIAGSRNPDGSFPAALISIARDGARKTAVQGQVRFRANPPNKSEPMSAGYAHWGVHRHPDDDKLRPLDFHLGTWFACLQGCCQFTESAK